MDHANAAVRALPSAKGRLQQGLDRLREEDAAILLEIIRDARAAETRTAGLVGDSRALGATDRLAVIKAFLGGRW